MYICEPCDFNCNQEFILQRHMNHRHADEDWSMDIDNWGDVACCDYCFFSSQSPAAVDNHERVSHPDEYAVAAAAQHERQVAAAELADAMAPHPDHDTQ